MPFRTLAVAFVVLAWATLPARGAPPAALLCTPEKTVDCVLDELLVLDGSASLVIPGETPSRLVTQCDNETQAKAGLCRVPRLEDVLNYGFRLLASHGLSTLTWDSVVLFVTDMSGTGGPVYNRLADVNPVGGIGRPVVPRPPGQPFIGWINGGNTTSFGTWVVPDQPVPRGLQAWPDPDPAGVPGYAVDYPDCGGTSSCPAFPFDGYNGFQALAQAVGRMFGPDVTVRATGFSRESVSSGDRKPVRGSADRNFTVGVTRSGPVRSAWSSALDFDSSLMGGNNWKPTGSGTWETTYPEPHWAASPPYQGKRLFRFHPFELYLMGLLPPEALKPIGDFSAVSAQVRTANADQPHGPAYEIDLWPYDRAAPTNLLNFGNLPFVRIRARASVLEIDRTLDPAEIIANAGPRSPAFPDAPHAHRQLWMVLTKPFDQAATARALRFMQRWRRAWNAYFYMLTSYRGRMVTTFDGSYDDSPYWEFAQPIDESRTFLPDGGLQATFPEPFEEPGPSPIINSVVLVNTPGQTGVLRFSAHENQPPLLIKSALDHPGAFNTAALRMRIPRGALPRNQAYALLRLGPGDVTLRLPAHESSFLIPDGRWHTYTADLTKVPGYPGQDYRTLELVPSSVAAGGIQIDFLRFAWVAPDKLGDQDRDCTHEPRPDGFIDTEDNCPKLYNPDQADEDGNGVGDACEDFDNDGAPNACDNCPRLTNSRQRDRDGDGTGDACDPDPGSGCFLQPESIAGPGAPVPATLVLGVGLLLWLTLRQRRQRLWRSFRAARRPQPPAASASGLLVVPRRPGRSGAPPRG